MLDMLKFFGPLAQFDGDDIVTGCDYDVVDMLVGLEPNDMGVVIGLFFSLNIKICSSPACSIRKLQISTCGSDS